MANSADPDQLASEEVYCLQRQGISGFSRTRVNKNLTPVPDVHKVCILFILVFD